MVTKVSQLISNSQLPLVNQRAKEIIQGCCQLKVLQLLQSCFYLSRSFFWPKWNHLSWSNQKYIVHIQSFHFPKFNRILGSVINEVVWCKGNDFSQTTFRKLRFFDSHTEFIDFRISFASYFIGMFYCIQSEGLAPLTFATSGFTDPYGSLSFTQKTFRTEGKHHWNFVVLRVMIKYILVNVSIPFTVI